MNKYVDVTCEKGRICSVCVCVCERRELGKERNKRMLELKGALRKGRQIAGYGEAGGRKITMEENITDRGE